jgi:hypothetical protein
MVTAGKMLIIMAGISAQKKASLGIYGMSRFHTPARISTAYRRVRRALKVTAKLKNFLPYFRIERTVRGHLPAVLEFA